MIVTRATTNPATPNHALQRTAPRVTVAANSSSNPSRPSMALSYVRCLFLRSTTQLPRHAPPSLSLGSVVERSISQFNTASTPARNADSSRLHRYFSWSLFRRISGSWQLAPSSLSRHLSRAFAICAPSPSSRPLPVRRSERRASSVRGFAAVLAVFRVGFVFIALNLFRKRRLSARRHSAQGR